MENQETNNAPAPENNEQKGGEEQKFDVNKVGKSSWIHGGIALVGAVSIFLPWVKVSFMGMSSSASGINAWQGVIALLAYLGIAAIAILGNTLKIPAQVKGQIDRYGVFVPAAFTVWTLIDVLTTNIVQPGIGLWLSLLASTALILIAYKVIKLK